MPIFEDREKGFERKFAHDEEMQFRAQARRNRLLGLWAAGRMGITDPDQAREYAQEIVRADFQGRGGDDLFRKLRDDLRVSGVGVTEEELRRQMDGLLAEAKAQLMEDGR